MAIDMKNVKTLADISPGPDPDRSPAETLQFLSFYYEHREAHPLPWGWDDDLADITAFAHGGPQVDPIMEFTRETWKGAVYIKVDLTDPVCATVYITDYSGEGMTTEELIETISVLLGAEIGVVHLKDKEPNDEDAGTLELDFTQYEPDETEWGCVFAVDPYPPRGTKPCELDMIEIGWE